MHICQPMNHPVTSFGKNKDRRIVNQNKLPFSLGPPHPSWHLDDIKHPNAKPKQAQASCPCRLSTDKIHVRGSPGTSFNNSLWLLNDQPSLNKVFTYLLTCTYRLSLKVGWVKQHILRVHYIHKPHLHHFSFVMPNCLINCIFVCQPSGKLCRTSILPCNLTVYQTWKKAFNHISKKGELKKWHTTDNFLRNFKVFGNLVTYGPECFIYIVSSQTKLNLKRRHRKIIIIVKLYAH